MKPRPRVPSSLGAQVARWLASPLLALLAGCGSLGSATGGADIRELHLFGVPVAINLDQNPGPDAFAVRVYASNGREAAGQRIDRGKLEIVLYDGGLSDATRTNAVPLRTWEYDSTKLKTYAARSSIGWGYRFAPQWGDNKPTQDRITVLVRYVSPSKKVIASSPSVISMALH